jgi:hypothetical protein
MRWFRRGREERPQESEPEQEDSPAALRESLDEMIDFINSHAGRLPGEGVVAARRVTDTLRSIIDTSDDGELDVYAIVSVKGVLKDYLPTTLRTYLALDPAATDVPGRSGRTPEDALLKQIESLFSAATEVLAAARAQDVDALETQGNFLRTKFSGSDLDL